MKTHTNYIRFVKPGFDLAAAFLLLIAFSPVMFVIAVLLVFSGQPIFFTQLRPGLYAQLFRVYKFKTMIDNDPVRVFPFGSWLRRHSLDELPQLYNVIKGEMSLIGPRPLLEHHLSDYNALQSRRHLVKPGLTGWAQVNGRNRLTLNEKIGHDIHYVNQVSMSLDLKILFKTLIQLSKYHEADYHQSTLKMKEHID